mgnify:CR=1 FL=1
MTQKNFDKENLKNDKVTKSLKNKNQNSENLYEQYFKK